MMPATIQIKNPRVRELVAEEKAHGFGRSFTEVAENLILDAAERRRIERATATRLPVVDGQQPVPTCGPTPAVA